MMWTPAQLAAIQARDENLLLSAAAGSGKTTVLVERVASLLTQGMDIRDMLIVTFTRAAAADMRMSLIRRLTALAASNPRYRQQAAYVESASISTIHSFCTDLLRDYFQNADVDPSFRIADGAEAGILRARALESAMNARYAENSTDHQALCAARTPDQIRELTLRLHSFLMERPDPWAWLDQHISSLEKGEDLFSPTLVERAQSRLQDACSLAQYAVLLTERADNLFPYCSTALNDLHWLESLHALDYEGLRTSLQRPAWMRLPAVRGLKDDPDAQTYKKLRDQIKKIVESASEALPIDLSGALQDLSALAAELRGLRELVQSLEEEYTRLKEERSLLTFSDLERRALTALQDDDVAHAVQDRYACIFVDEYQDVSDMQEAILLRAARKNALFCVGDVKQSIYRFRHAEPSLFMRRYDAYRRGEGGRLIVLSENFRSRASILAYTNEVFRRIMVGGSSEIVYDEDAQLHPGAQFPGEDAPIELYIIDKSKQESDEDASESDAARLITEMKDAEAEALLVARRMAALHGTPIWDGKKGAWRPLQWRDFVILTRQARDVAQLMLAILRREGIPAYADLSGGYLDVMEVQVALALLRLVENRRRDPEWIAVLRAPHMGLSSEDLARIRTCSPQGDYVDAVITFTSKEAGDPLAEKLQTFLHQLDTWRALGQALSLSQQLSIILRESGFYQVVGALPGGAQRQANLDALCNRAESYEQVHAGGLTGFLTYLEDVNAVSQDMGEAHVLGENDDVVRIMTVHKSKGLEFPVVFGILLGRHLGGGSNRSDFFAHRNVGVGIKHIDAALGARRDTLPRLAAQALNEQEEQAEEMRILYVLLTRARDRLILTGSVSDANKALINYAVSASQPLTPTCYLDMLVPAMLTMPGGEVLGGEADTIDPSLPRVRVQIVSRTSLAQEEEQAGKDSAHLMDEARAKPADEELLQAYQWVYPHEQAVLLPLKLTASGLSREITGPAQPPELIPRPLFLSEECSMTGAERGTATHAALQCLNLTALKNLQGNALHQAIETQLSHMAEQGALTRTMHDAVRPDILTRFLQSNLGQRMIRADTIHREWMFTLKMTTEEGLGIPSEEELLVQGAVDCCFLENGQWILMDYKTDRANDENALVERYKPQLTLYKKALERITNIPVAEVWLCLLGANHQLRLA